MLRNYLAVAAIAGCGLAWFAAGRWLGGFGYRIGLDPLVFLGVGITAMMLAGLTVSGQAWRAARMNPVDALERLTRSPGPNGETTPEWANGIFAFIGSSSIRMWDTARSFDPMAVMNRGFGGAHISDILAFWDRAAAPYDPSAIVIYCGDNDVADGKPVEQVVADIWAPMVETGIPPDSSLFLDDGLHLSQEGYGIWQRVVAAALNRVLH